MKLGLPRSSWKLLKDGTKRAIFQDHANAHRLVFMFQCLAKCVRNHPTDAHVTNFLNVRDPTQRRENAWCVLTASIQNTVLEKIEKPLQNNLCMPTNLHWDPRNQLSFSYVCRKRKYLSTQSSSITSSCSSIAVQSLHEKRNGEYIWYYSKSL